MSYTLTKLSIKEGHTSAVGVGDSSTSNEIKVIRKVKPEEIQPDDEVFVGRNALSYIKTSPVERIEKYEDYWCIWTRTSYYHLEIDKKKG